MILFCILGGREVARWSFGVTFAVAIAGAALYFLENAGHVALLAPLTGLEHKYSRLLLITVAVLVIGMGAFGLGLRRSRPEA